MTPPQLNPGQEVVVARGGLDQMLQVLSQRGYRVIGPTVRDRAIVYDEIATTEDLPVGWTDEHDGGHYRLYRRDDEALFGYVVGPHSWKRFLHLPVQRLWRAATISAVSTLRIGAADHLVVVRNVGKRRNGRDQARPVGDDEIERRADWRLAVACV